MKYSNIHVFKYSHIQIFTYSKLWQSIQPDGRFYLWFCTMLSAVSQDLASLSRVPVTLRSKWVDLLLDSKYSKYPCNYSISSWQRASCKVISRAVIFYKRLREGAIIQVSHTHLLTCNHINSSKYWFSWRCGRNCSSSKRE